MMATQPPLYSAVPIPPVPSSSLDACLPSPSPDGHSDRLGTSRVYSANPSPSRPSPEAGPVASLPPERSHGRHGPGASRQHSGTGAGASASERKSPQLQKPARTSMSPTPPAQLLPSAMKKDRPSAHKLPQDMSPDTYSRAGCYSDPDHGETSLGELAHLVRLAKYQSRKRCSTRIRLQRSLISTALSARLTRCGEVTQRNLADCFRSEDKKAFANLYNAIQDVRSSCDAARRFALLEPDMHASHPPSLAPSDGLDETSGAGGSGHPAPPFLDEIPAPARQALLTFLVQLRTNPDYLATRLCALTSSQLQAMNTFHQGIETVESVLPQYSRPNGRSNLGSPLRKVAGSAPSSVERLLSFQRHDPLSALIYTCFANTSGPGSAEDKRRTEVWANACARLISGATASSAREPILFSVLNTWASMREWTGRSNMEWYLMKILEDGAFLLDRAEDQNGTRFNISEWTHKDNVAAEEFYDRAVQDLFDMIDDEDCTGIPEGVVELGSAILQRLDSKLAESVRKWLVVKWLFTSWLPAVVVHPEGYGMMSEYHITKYGRQKILKEVVQRAQQMVVDATWKNRQPSGPIPPKVMAHMENILNRFRPSRTRKSAVKLLPARSVTSLRETEEVHPYLVVSPVDLVTLVNALFPEKRSQSTRSSSIRSGRSGAPSLSALSAISPISLGSPRQEFDNASVMSMGASSVVSDTTTNRVGDGEAAVTPQRYSPPLHDVSGQKSLGKYEEDGARLRLAMQDMVQSLGADVVSGSCHPCAERWAVLFVSPDGHDLSLRMTYDPDEEPEDENSSSTSEMGEDVLEDGPELDKDYHQLRDSVLRLVEEFEIPQSPEDDGTRPTFSNRASGPRRHKSRTNIDSQARSTGSRNPYRSSLEPQSGSDSTKSPSTPESGGMETNSADKSESPAVLIEMLTAASSQARVQSNFVGAHAYWKTLQGLEAIESPSLRRNGFATLISIFSRGPRDSIHRSTSAIEEYDAWLVWLKQSLERHEGLIEDMMKRLRALRDKMWYVADVHQSAPYEQTRNICSALKIMGVPRKSGGFQRTRAQLSRGPAASFLYKNETQMLDLLAASEEQGGPNKLSDDQAEKTTKWLDQLGIENFCRGEERIHRFCCEVDSCVNKLIGDNMVDGPVLWSSELFLRDRKAVENTRLDQESGWHVEESSIIMTDLDRRLTTASLRRPHSIARDLRSMTTHNSSQLSIGSRYSGRGPVSDILDPQDYFGAASPVHAIDPSTTFWSPFQSSLPSSSSVRSRILSPATSITELSGSSMQPHHRPLSSPHPGTRPGSSSCSNETVQFQRLSDQKQRFLDELRHTLRTLLVSDLGIHVFPLGSETDAWFKGLGQECIDRQLVQERDDSLAVSGLAVSAKATLSEASTKHRVIEKKKSFGNLRGADEEAAAKANSGKAETTVLQTHAGTYPPKPCASLEAADFPYKKAYQRLLKMFSVHPNPYTKMNALCELEQLLIASSSASSRQTRWNLRDHFNESEVDDGNMVNSTKVTQTIDSVKERRSHLLHSPARHANADTRSPGPTTPSNTGVVVSLLQSLFQDASIRPQTLFRDLQFIAAFVPPSMLDKTDRGKAFWDTGLAALSLKQDVCRTMMVVADEVVRVYTQPNKVPAPADVGSGSRVRPVSSYKLADAARMWTITAKEGHATAQRELALFHLSSPELVERTTLPLSKPREVFKQAVMAKYGARTGSSARYAGERLRSGLGGGGGGGGGGQAGSNNAQEGGKDSDVRNDPAMMCVAIHWMEAAEKGGDDLARTFLGQNEVMGLG